MIMPGVQKPHWRPCWSQNACWSGWRLAPSAIPSIVLISRPSAWTASIVHDLALWPSTWTVHAPQLLVSQPMWVPVSPRSSRRKWTSSRRGSTSASCDRAVDGDRDVLGGHRAWPPTRTRWRDRRRVRSARTIISATIARLYSTGPWTSATGRLCAAGGDAGGAEEVLRWVRCRAGAPRRRSPRTASGRPPVSPIPARAIVAVVVEPTIAATPHGREVARPCARASSYAAAGRASAGGPSGSRSGPRSARSPSGTCRRRSSRAAISRSPVWLRQTIVALPRDEDGRPVARTGRRGRTEPPIVPQLRTCGSPIAPVDVDAGAGSGRGRPRVLVDLAVGRPGADAQVVVRLDDLVEAVDVPDVDEQGRLREAELDQRQEAVAARRGAWPRPRDPSGSGAPRPGSPAGRSRTGRDHRAGPSSPPWAGADRPIRPRTGTGRWRRQRAAVGAWLIHGQVRRAGESPCG